MFIKVEASGRSVLYPTVDGQVEYGVLYLYSDPIVDQSWLNELREKTGYTYCRFLIHDEGNQPTGHRSFLDPENHPDEEGKPWWEIHWVAFDDGSTNDGSTTRSLIVTSGFVYLLNNNGKTIDKVR